MLTTTLPNYVNDCEKPSRRHKDSPCLRLRQKQNYDRKANVISLETGHLILPKANAYKGKGKCRPGGSRNHMKWNARSLMVSPHTL